MEGNRIFDKRVAFLLCVLFDRSNSLPVSFFFSFFPFLSFRASLSTVSRGCPAAEFESDKKLETSLEQSFFRPLRGKPRRGERVKSRIHGRRKGCIHGCSRYFEPCAFSCVWLETSRKFRTVRNCRWRESRPRKFSILASYAAEFFLGGRVLKRGLEIFNGPDPVVSIPWNFSS